MPCRSAKLAGLRGLPLALAIAHPYFRVTFSANGRSFTTPGPAVNIITFQPDGSPDTFTTVGLVAAIHLPRQSVFLLDAGKIVFRGELGGAIITEVGPHQLFGMGETGSLCATLSGN